MKEETLKKLAYFANKKVLKIYDYLQTEEGKQKLKDSNYKIGIISAKFKLTKEEVDLYLEEVCSVSQSKQTREVCMLIKAIKENIVYKPGEKTDFEKVLNLEEKDDEVKTDAPCEKEEIPTETKKEVKAETTEEPIKRPEDPRKTEILKALEEPVKKSENKPSLSERLDLTPTKTLLGIGFLLFTVFVMFKLYTTFTKPRPPRFVDASLEKKDTPKKSRPLPVAGVKIAPQEESTPTVPSSKDALIIKPPVQEPAIVKPTIEKPAVDNKVMIKPELATPVTPQAEIIKPVVPTETKTKTIVATEKITTPAVKEVSIVEETVAQTEEVIEEEPEPVFTFRKIKELIDNGEIVVGNDTMIYKQRVYKKGDLFNGFLIKKIKKSYVKVYSIENELSKKIRTK